MLKLETHGNPQNDHMLTGYKIDTIVLFKLRIKYECLNVLPIIVVCMMFT